MVPPTIRGRSLKSFKGSGDYTVNDVIATTELDEEIQLAQYWPVRKPRPYAEKLGVTGYKYPHSYPNHYVSQQYMPNELNGKKYYEAQDNKYEESIKRYWAVVKEKK